MHPADLKVIIPVGLVTILIELSPCDLVTCSVEHRLVRSPLLARGELLGRRFAVDIHEVDLLGTGLSPGRSSSQLDTLTFCLVCHAGGSFGSFAV